ncbi:MAG: RluA family pseudouridine synthase [Bacillota bacterium]
MVDEIYKINSELSGLRIDKFLAKKHKDFSRSYIQKLINEEYVKINNKSIKKSYKLKKGDSVEVYEKESEELDLEPYELDLTIIYEDKNIIVINKPAGLLVHPSPHEKKKTLVNALLDYTNDLSGIGGVKRPGIVHRLDKNTSGAIVVAKDDKSHRNLIKQFKNRNTEKIYKAIVIGEFKYKDGKIVAPIGRDDNNRTKMAVTKKNSKKAITHFEVIAKNSNYSYLKLKLETGRTHQIRVHLSYLGYPILGDFKYGNNNENIKSNLKVERQLLHSYSLSFYHPIKNNWMEFKAELPADFTKILSELFQ